MLKRCFWLIMLAIAVLPVIFIGSASAATIVENNITSAATWTAANSPYVIKNNISIGENTSLTIRPGVVVKFYSGTKLDVNGTLDAEGTAVDFIYFTDYRDDAAGGDTNGDGTATSALPGGWDAIYVNNMGNAVLDHCIIQYGGNNSFYKCNLYTDSKGNLTLSDSTISNSKYDGLSIDNSSGIHTITHNSFRNNGESGIILDNSAASICRNGFYENNTGITCQNNANPTIGGASSEANNIFNNKLFGVQNLDTGNTTIIDAKYNWWGDSTGPFNALTNPNGKGNQVSANVDYSNYSTQSVGPKVWPAQTNQSPTKNWIIKFSLPVDISTVNNQNIYVLSTTGTVTGVNPTLGKDGMSVIVTPPANGWQNGNTYTLVIGHGIKSASGKSLTILNIMDFTIAP